MAKTNHGWCERVRKMRIKCVVAVLGICASSQSLRADQLIMEDGRVLHGQVINSAGAYAFVDSNGTTTQYDKEDVKRWVDVAEVTPKQANAMLQELNELVLPILTADEPEQFSFVDESTTSSSDGAFDAQSSGGFANGSFVSFRRRGAFGINAGIEADRFSSRDSRQTEVVSTVRRDKGVDNVFVDEWARYTATFAALDANPQYRLLTNRRQNSDSLADFARRPPQDIKPTAQALRTALISLRDCIAAAEATQKRIRAIPIRAVNHEEDIQQLEIKLARAQSDLDAAPHSRRLERRVRVLENRLRKRVSRAELDAQRNARVVERKINDFARKRETTIAQLRAVEQLLTSAAVTPPAPGPSNAP